MNNQAFWESFSKAANEAVNKYDMSSVAIGVIKDNEIVFTEGFGMRDVEKSLPADKNTMYQIGSCSKAFTAALVAILVDQGKLNWDTPIREYVPNVKFYDEFTSKECTLRDLLSHRTGMPRHEYSWYCTDFDRAELVDHMKYLEPSQPIRTVMQYCNYGFVLAGHIVEVVTGKTWEENLQELIFDPLGMNRTNCYIDTIEEDDNHGVPYDRPEDGDGLTGKKEIPFYKTPCEDREKGIGASFAAAGSINSTVADMLKWVQMHLNKGKVGENQIISEASVAEMHKPQMLRTNPYDMPNDETIFMTYGLGWFVEVFRGHKFIQHGGNVNGFSAFTCFVPDLSLGVVAYTNMNGTMIGYALARTIVDHFMGVEDGNWVDRYYELAKESNASLPELIKHFTGEQIPDTVPSHPMAEYAGTYRRDGYSDMVIREEDGVLTMDFIGAVNTLNHFHYDTFVTTAIVGELPPGMPARFLTAEVGGKIDRISMPLVTEAGGKPIVFQKVAE